MRRARARLLARPWLDSIAHLADRHARTLSGGEVQRVAIARALAVRSRVLLLDEPFAGLDATTQADLIADLRTALDQSTAAVLLVTHDRDEAAALAHRTALLVRGRIRQVGTTADVLDSPADLECATCSATPPTCRPSSPATTCFSSPGPNAAGSCRPGERRHAPEWSSRARCAGSSPGGTTRVDVDTAAGPIAVLTTTEVAIAPGDPLCVTVDAGNTRECPPRPDVGPPMDGHSADR